MKKTLSFLILLPISIFCARPFNEMAQEIFDRYEREHAATSWHHIMLQATYGKGKSAQELSDRGVAQEILDHMAIEYVRCEQNLFLVVLFPPGDSDPTRAKEALSQNGEIIYEKTIACTANGMKNLLRATYDVHHCSGWRADNQGIYARFAHLLKAPQTLRVLLWECASLPKAIKTKQHIRKIYNDNNEICHFTDYPDETLHMAHIFFSNATINFHNRAKSKVFPRFKKYTQTLKEFADKNPSFRYAYCVDAGGVLAAYGIRDCGDCDIVLHGDDHPPIQDLGINNFARQKRGFDIDEIIYNPKEHFYYKGVRFINLEGVAAFKQLKSKSKDRRDLRLIRKFLR